MSLRFRLSLLIAAITLSAMTLFAVLEYTLFTRTQNTQLELLVARDLSRAQTLFMNPEVGANLSGLNEGSFRQQFVSGSGFVVIPPAQTPLPLVPSPELGVIDGVSVLLASTPWLSQTGSELGTIRVALDVSAALAARQTLRRSLIISSLIIASLSVLIGLWIVRRALNPLRNLAREARAVDPAKPSITKYLGPNDEVADVAHALNTALESIRERQELERASLAEIAHELAAPLSLVAGHLNSLQNQIEDPRLESAKDAADELLYTSQDLLTLARGELEKPLDFRICDLAEVLKKVARAYPSVHFTTLDTAQIAANPERLTQMIRNLVRNAVQATADTGEVWLELSRQVDNFMILVKDTGPGIPKADLENIFDRFFTKSGGVGVGLSVAKQIVDQHEGQITVVSELGSGTAFTVQLPSLDSMTE